MASRRTASSSSVMASTIRAAARQWAVASSVAPVKEQPRASTASAAAVRDGLPRPDGARHRAQAPFARSVVLASGRSPRWPGPPSASTPASESRSVSSSRAASSRSWASSCRPRLLLDRRRTPRSAAPSSRPPRRARGPRPSRSTARASLEAARRSSRAVAAGQQQLHPLGRRRALGQQAQGGLEPAGRAGRQPAGGGLGRLDQHGDRDPVAVAGRLLDVVGPARWPGRPVAKRGGAPGVGGEPAARRWTPRRWRCAPAGGGSGTGGGPAPGGPGRGRSARRGRPGPRARYASAVAGGEVELERVAHHRRRLGEAPAPPARGRPAPGRWRPPPRAGRLSPSAAVRTRGPAPSRGSGPVAAGRRGSRRSGGRAGPGWHASAPAAARAASAGARGPSSRRSTSPARSAASMAAMRAGAAWPRPEAARQQHRRLRAAGAAGGPPARWSCRRPSAGRRGPAPTAAGPPAARAARAPRSRSGSARSRSDGRSPAERSERSDGKTSASSSQAVGRQPVDDARGPSDCDVGVEGVDDDPERQLLLELGGAALQHQAAPGLGPAHQLAQHVGLADARLAADEHGPGRTGTRLGEEAVEHRQLGIPPHEQLGPSAHV